MPIKSSRVDSDRTVNHLAARFVKNEGFTDGDSSTYITAGSMVAITGLSGGFVTVSKADANGAAKLRNFLWVAKDEIRDYGEITRWAEVSKDTSAGAIGDLVYLSDTAGGLSLTAGTNVIVVGKILVAATAGTVEVDCSLASTTPGSTIVTDIISEQTAGAGVTIDGLRLKDAAITPVAGGAAWADLSAVATGEADTIVGANLASAWAIRTAALTYLDLVSTTATPGLVTTFTRTGAGAALDATMSLNHATNAGQGIASHAVQLTTARTSGTLAAVQAKTTSLAGDAGGTYADFSAVAPTDGGGTNTHVALLVGAGHDVLIDASAAATGETDIVIGDNLASAFEIREAANVYLRAVTTNSSEALQSHQRLTTTDGVASGINRIVGGVVYTATAASAAITGATETETLFDSQISLPANTLKAGTTVRIRAQGIHTATTGAETHSMILKIGSVAITTMAAIDPVDNDIFYFDCTLVCRTAGAGGTVVATGVQLAQAASGVGTAKPFALASTVLNTTGANIVGVAIDRQAAAVDSDSARLDVLVVEVLG